MIEFQNKNAAEVSYSRTTSLITHVAKIVTNIHTKGLGKKIQKVVGENLYGFREWKRT